MNKAEVQTDKEKLQEILNRDEYTAYMRERSGNPIFEWLQEKLEKIADLFPELDIAPGTPNVVAYLLLGFLLAALAAAILWMMRLLILERRSRRRIVFRSAVELDRSSARLAEEAQRFAAAGDYPEAVRHAFLALLLLMNEREWVRAQTWKTNREYAEELHDREPAAARSFIAAARLFEHVYYGRGEAEARDYERMTELLASLVREGAGHAETK